MTKSLVIVESPAKVKSISKYLGKDYIVKSSVGHIRDLPGKATGKAKQTITKEDIAHENLSKEEQKQRLAELRFVNSLGVDPYNNWLAQYQIIIGKEKIVKELKKYTKEVDQVILATDLDREGEAIAWHLRECIRVNKQTKFQRIIFNEITKDAIQKAIQNPISIDENKVFAQQTRRFLDRLVGYMVSPVLWRKVAKGLSAGRVQSVALRLICEREAQINSFVPQEYWRVYAHTENATKNKITFEVIKFENKEFKPLNSEECNQHLDKLKTIQYQISNVEKKQTKVNPTPPFITSTLQRAASTYLNLNVNKTMMIAQKLYENGHITYMRTDSTNISNEAMQSVRGYIDQQFGSDYLSEKENRFKSKSNAQEAHEAIRPTNITNTNQIVNPDELKLYQLIWQKFVASQMKNAVYNNTNILINDKGYELKAKGRILVFDGFYKVWKFNSDKDDILPDVKKGEQLNLDKLDPKKLYTRPSVRFNEASLVLELEKKGIGRPSTYAKIISTIIERGYVEIKEKKFYTTKIGEIVSQRLIKSFDSFMDYNFTANMENDLDSVADGKKNWKKILDTFFSDLKNKVDLASEREGMLANIPLEIELECEKCNRKKMLLHQKSNNLFLGCSGYFDEENKCSHIINLMPEILIKDKDDESSEGVDEELKLPKDLKIILNSQRCKKCQYIYKPYFINSETKLLLCSNLNCNHTKIEKGQYDYVANSENADTPNISCNRCQSDMEFKSGRFGPFYACTNCDNTRKVMKDGKVAPPKMKPIDMPHLQCDKNPKDHYVLRESIAGLFLAASKFPKIRETRTPYLNEVISVKDQLEDKFDYILKGPISDPDGHKSILKFDKKLGKHYLASKKDGKPTKWRYDFKETSI